MLQFHVRYLYHLYFSLGHLQNNGTKGADQGDSFNAITICDYQDIPSLKTSVHTFYICFPSDLDEFLEYDIGAFLSNCCHDACQTTKKPACQNRSKEKRGRLCLIIFDTDTGTFSDQFFPIPVARLFSDTKFYRYRFRCHQKKINNSQYRYLYNTGNH